MPDEFEREGGREHSNCREHEEGTHEVLGRRLHRRRRAEGPMTPVLAVGAAEK